MERMSALLAQRGPKAAEVDKAVAELAALDAEIRATAAQLAGVADIHPETANGAAHPVGENGSNGTNGHGVPMMGPFTSAVTPPSNPRPQLAQRKMELLGLLRDKPEVGLAHLAIRMYGNEGRSARVNVTEYCADLEAHGYIKSGSRPDTFCLTEKGRAMCQ
jgi:hypothetical protein